MLDGVKRRKGSLASGKILVWPLSTQNLIHTDVELGSFAKHQTDPLLVQLVAVRNAYLLTLATMAIFQKLSNWFERVVDGLFIDGINFSQCPQII